MSKTFPAPLFVENSIGDSMGKSNFVIYEDRDEFVCVTEDRETAERLVAHLNSASGCLSENVMDALGFRGATFGWEEVPVAYDESDVADTFERERKFYGRYTSLTDADAASIKKLDGISKGVLYGDD